MTPRGLRSSAGTSPDAIVVITDGMTPWPPTPPPGASSVIAALTNPYSIPNVPGCPGTRHLLSRRDVRGDSSQAAPPVFTWVLNGSSHWSRRYSAVTAYAGRRTAGHHRVGCHIAVGRWRAMSRRNRIPRSARESAECSNRMRSVAGSSVAL